MNDLDKQEEAIITAWGKYLGAPASDNLARLIVPSDFEAGYRAALAVKPDPEKLAREFHEALVRLYGVETWEQFGEDNRTALVEAFQEMLYT